MAEALTTSVKRTEERLINHLTREEMNAVLDAPNPNTRTGVRDQVMLYLGFAAGLRASELVGLRLEDIESARQVDSRLRHERGQPGDKIQRLEDDMGRAIAVRGLEL